MIGNIIFTLILQIIGVATILAEFIIPSLGMLTALALGIFGYSLYFVNQHFNQEVLILLIIFDAMMIPVVLWVGVRMLANSPMALNKTLRNKDNNSNNILGREILAGTVGETITRLAPSGKALIAGSKYDVVSTGDFIDSQEKIAVVEVNGNRIVVRKTD